LFEQLHDVLNIVQLIWDGFGRNFVTVSMLEHRTKMGRGEIWTNNAVVLMIALIATALQDVAVATEYTVGNATGWDFAPTSTYYDDWASTLKFVPGDKLGKSVPSCFNSRYQFHSILIQIFFQSWISEAMSP
jgi:hypothetical protein